MKSLSILLILIVALCGCSVVQIAPESQATIAKIAGRHVGYELMLNYPDVAKEVLPVCQTILNADGNDLIVNLTDQIIITLISVEINDPLLVADISNLVDMIQVKIETELTPEQAITIKAVAEGLSSGIEIASEND